MRMRVGRSASGRLLLGALAAMTLALASPAEALCITQPEDGHWVNVDPNTTGITRVWMRFVCQDQILNGELYPPGPPWYAHLWGRCHPNDCDWGEVGAQRISSGHIYAVYDQGFVRRYVYVKMSQYLPGHLWVYIWSDFRDPSRPDYASQHWFRRE